MTAQDIRLQCLALVLSTARQEIYEPAWVIAKAEVYEAYIRGEGQAEPPPQKRRGRPPKARPDTVETGESQTPTPGDSVSS
jgi:hypothetical protein